MRAGTPLSAKEKAIHDKGLVSILRQIHDELDAAVLEAYGWQDLAANGPPCSVGLRPSTANEEAPSLESNGIDGHRPPLQNTSTASSPESFLQELLTRLVALNHERAAEEKRGLIRYLRPDYQNPSSAAPQPVQAIFQGPEAPTSQSKIHNRKSSIVNPSIPWPASLSAQVTAIQKLLPTHGPDAELLSARFGKKSAKRTQQVAEILETLQGLGKL